MLRHANLGTIFGVGLLAEILVFTIVADRIGFGSALFLTLAVSVFGVAMLRRSGLSALATWRRLADEGGRAPEGAVVDGLLAGLGALLLIVPGFLTDILGLVLLAPSGRSTVRRRLGLGIDVPSGPRSTRGERTIDLGEGDWTRLDNAAGR